MGPNPSPVRTNPETFAARKEKGSVFLLELPSWWEVTLEQMGLTLSPGKKRLCEMKVNTEEMKVCERQS